MDWSVYTPVVITVVIVAVAMGAIYLLRARGTIVRAQTVTTLEEKIANLENSLLAMERQLRSAVQKELEAHRLYMESVTEIDTLKRRLEDALTRLRSVEIDRQVGKKPRFDHRILGVWPGVQGQQPLDQRREKRAVYNSGIPYTALIGEVERKTILGQLRRRVYTILEVGAHGQADGILLTDGIAPAGWWRRVLFHYHIQVAVLLACHSEDALVDAFLSSGVSAVVSVQREILDASSISFAEALYENLVTGETLATAVDLAKLALSDEEAELILIAGDPDWKLEGEPSYADDLLVDSGNEKRL
jgi:hypothetical protein